MTTKVIKVDGNLPDKNAIEFAATLLRDGGLVAFATETVYGIGANFLDEKAVRRLCEVKKRPANKPFTIHISDTDAIKEMGCEISPLAKRFIGAFWPGPLTLVLKLAKAQKPRSTYEVDLVGRPRRSTSVFKGNKLGFRMPSNSIAKMLISETGLPLAVPSANASGEEPPVEASEVLKKLDGKIDLILDSGKTEFGRESTVLDMTVFPYKILRKGAIGEEEIRRVADSV